MLWLRLVIRACAVLFLPVMGIIATRHYGRFDPLPRNDILPRRRPTRNGGPPATRLLARIMSKSRAVSVYMLRTCKKCSAEFSLSQRDLDFYKKVSPKLGNTILTVPPPTLCPNCRKQRRLLFRNERSLYHRTCDLTGQTMLSIHRQGTAFPVYENSAWWSDGWDALQFGRPFDFERGFFEQFVELRDVVPRINLYVDSLCENSKFCNQITMCRNCYLMFACSSNEDCYYGYRVNNSRNCIDCLMTNDSELCFQCIETFSSYNCRFSQKISQCTDSAFLYDCRSCQHCLFSVGLRNKEYCIFNEQLTKREFEAATRQYNFGSANCVAQYRQDFARFIESFPRRAAMLRNTENVTGDNIENAKNCEAVFDGANLEDVSYCHFFQDAKDCMDINFGCDDVELCYEVSTTGIRARQILFSMEAWPNVSDLLYCDSCSNGTNFCFGCVGLKKERYCILNMQYSKEEYESLVPRIVRHMTERGEWGEFFPAWCSTHGYQETPAMQHFPLTATEAAACGFNWQANDSGTMKPQSAVVPDAISDADDTVLSSVFACTCCGKNYRIIPQELQFYQRAGVPLPQQCSDCRHYAQVAQRTPAQLYSRTCSACTTAILTCYAPDRAEQVLCEQCYLEQV